jgi:hypothetical protein
METDRAVYSAMISAKKALGLLEINKEEDDHE